MVFSVAHRSTTTELRQSSGQDWSVGRGLGDDRRLGTYPGSFVLWARRRKIRIWLTISIVLA